MYIELSYRNFNDLHPFIEVQVNITNDLHPLTWHIFTARVQRR